MTVAQQGAQIALLARGHPDRWKAILCEQRQQQHAFVCVFSAWRIFAG
jgi:hypothetical protein